MGFRLGFILISFLFIFIFVVASRLVYHARWNNKFSFKNMFPFEFNYRSTFIKNIYGNISIILAMTAALAFYITFDTSHRYGTLIMTMVAGAIASIIIVALCFVSFMQLRAHLILSVLLFALEFCVSSGVTLSSYRAYQDTKNVSSLIAFIVGLVFVVIVFALFLNPKLTLNFQGKEIVKADGSKEKVRPSFIALAMSEWVLIAVHMLNMIDIFILMLAFE